MLEAILSLLFLRNLWNGPEDAHRPVGDAQEKLTALPMAYFFSLPMTAPLRMAALRALLPLTTVSRSPTPPRTDLPILVTWSQSDILTAVDVAVVVD